MKKLLLLTFASLTVISCNNDDDGTPSNGNNTLFQSWHLIEVDGGFAGTHDEFNPGTIVWNFNESGTVQVINNNTDEDAADFFDTGSYQFEFVINEINPEDCDTILNINNTNFGCHNIANDTLTLNDQPLDGYRLTFKKN